MELIAILALVLLYAAVVPTLVWIAGSGRFERRIRRSVQIVDRLQALGLPPSGGLVPGAPPVLVYRDPDDAVVVQAQLSQPWTVSRAAGASPLGWRVVGDAGRVTLEALRVAAPLGATIAHGEVRVRVLEGGDLLHPIDGVREVHDLLEHPPPEAVEETIHASLGHPAQLGASLRTLAELAPARAEALARELWPRAAPRVRVELAAVLEDAPALLRVATTAVAEVDHPTAWEAARRLCALSGDPDPALAAAPALTAHELTAGGLLLGLSERPSPGRAAWLGAEVAGGLRGWADGRRAGAAATFAAISRDEDAVGALLTCRWAEGRAAAIAALAAWGTIRSVPALRAAQARSLAPGPLLERAVVAIQTRAGGAPGMLSMAAPADVGGALSLAGAPGGHLHLVDQPAGTIDTPSR